MTSSRPIYRSNSSRAQELPRAAVSASRASGSFPSCRSSRGSPPTQPQFLFSLVSIIVFVVVVSSVPVRLCASSSSATYHHTTDHESEVSCAHPSIDTTIRAGTPDIHVRHIFRARLSRVTAYNAIVRLSRVTSDHIPIGPTTTTIKHVYVHAMYICVVAHLLTGDNSCASCASCCGSHTQSSVRPVATRCCLECKSSSETVLDWADTCFRKVKASGIKRPTPSAPCQQTTPT